MKRSLAGAALTGLLLAGTALAQTAAPPPPPASASHKDAIAWAEKNLFFRDGPRQGNKDLHDAWDFEGFGDDELFFFPTKVAAPDGDGQTSTNIRHEFFVPATQLGVNYQSALENIQIDCKLNQLKHISTQFFPELNMVGEPKTGRPANTDWRPAPPGSPEDGTVKALCKLAK
jgi:hypothetical protein